MTQRKVDLRVERLEDRLTPAISPSLQSLANIVASHVGTFPVVSHTTVHHSPVHHAHKPAHKTHLVGVQTNDGGSGGGGGGGGSNSTNSRNTVTLPDGTTVDLPRLPKGFRITGVVPPGKEQIQMGLKRPFMDGELFPLPELELKLPEGVFIDGTGSSM